MQTRRDKMQGLQKFCEVRNLDVRFDGLNVNFFPKETDKVKHQQQLIKLIDRLKLDLKLNINGALKSKDDDEINFNFNIPAPTPAKDDIRVCEECGSLITNEESITEDRGKYYHTDCLDDIQIEKIKKQNVEKERLEIEKAKQEEFNRLPYIKRLDKNLQEQQSLATQNADRKI